ncbi:MAG TPA: oligoribonuclease [Gammaproteobacteria bacterium]|nr:oligoribonuclease [Gammaproteobacteria bacterium]
MNPRRDHLIWIDLEMTGLNPDRDHIIEIATVVTDSQLNTVAEGPNFVIHQPDSVLETMDEWNTNQHTKSGLVAKIKASHVTVEQAQAETIEFLMHHVPPGKSPMCGSSICQDRRFLYRWMPKLEQYFHYRNLDVSSIKILAQHWFPQILQGVKKESRHLALGDIYDSIAELRYYKERFFLLPDEAGRTVS